MLASKKIQGLILVPIIYTTKIYLCYLHFLSIPKIKLWGGGAAEMVGPSKYIGIDFGANNLCFKVLEYVCPLPFPAIQKIIPKGLQKWLVPKRILGSISVPIIYSPKIFVLPSFSRYSENKSLGGGCAEMVGPQKDTGIILGANNLCSLCFKVLEYLRPLPFPAIWKTVLRGLQEQLPLQNGYRDRPRCQ